MVSVAPALELLSGQERFVGVVEGVLMLSYDSFILVEHEDDFDHDDRHIFLCDFRTLFGPFRKAHFSPLIGGKYGGFRHPARIEGVFCNAPEAVHAAEVVDMKSVSLQHPFPERGDPEPDTRDRLQYVPLDIG